MYRMLLLLMGVSFSLQGMAFPCFITMVKDTCWTNYDVSVVVQDATKGTAITTIVVPKGKSWVRKEFVCQPGQSIVMAAAYSPVFWESDVGKTYPAKHNWVLPETIKQTETAWSITACFADMFSEVPLPPDAKGNCACKTDNIPAVLPQ